MPHGDTASSTDLPPLPSTERHALEAVMRQAESDLKASHAVVCELQGLDAKAHGWPEWSPQANTLRWFERIREKFGLGL